MLGNIALLNKNGKQIKDSRLHRFEGKQHITPTLIPQWLVNNDISFNYIYCEDSKYSMTGKIWSKRIEKKRYFNVRSLL